MITRNDGKPHNAWNNEKWQLSYRAAASQAVMNTIPARVSRFRVWLASMLFAFFSFLSRCGR